MQVLTGRVADGSRLPTRPGTFFGLIVKAFELATRSGRAVCNRIPGGSYDPLHTVE